MKRYLETGKVVGTHGIRGEMRVQPWSDTPEFVTRFSVLYLDDQGQNKLNISASRVHGNLVLLKVEGIDDINSASLYRNKILYMDRNDCELEEGSYFYQDLIGCNVVDANDGRLYGKLSDISETGANDVWHILASNQKEYLIPVIEDVVLAVDTAERLIKIRPLKGIFEDED